MSNNIILKKSSVGDKVPVAGDLQYGELALNYADGNLFYKNSSNSVTTIASNRFVSVTGNVTGGNIVTAGRVAATGIVSGLELTSSQSSGDEGGQINLAGAAANTTLSGNVVIDVYQNKLRFFEGSGNNRGAYIDLSAALAGVGSNLLAGGGGTPVSIVNGTSNVVVASSGNVTVSVAGTNNVATFTTQGIVTSGLISATGNINGGNVNSTFFGSGAGLTSLTGANVTGTVANATYAVSAGTATSAATAATAGTVTANAQANITSVGTLTSLSVTGNVTGSYFIGNGSQLTGITAGIKWTTVANTAPAGAKPGDFWYNSFSGIKYQYINDGTSNVWVDQSYPTTFSSLAVAGNGTIGGTLAVSGNVSAPLFVGTATQARYADLAENYSADADYAPGTVLVFGGTHEVTVSAVSHDTRVAGVVSTAPAYLMNSDQLGAAVALTGKVPCQVQGPVDKGDLLVNIGTGTAGRLNPDWYKPGCVVGKSLESIPDKTTRTIEIAVGRF